jgi:hypothetical protein
VSKTPFDKIAESHSQALPISDGTAAPAKLHVPSEMDVRAIRAYLMAIDRNHEDVLALLHGPTDTARTA